MIGLLQNSIRSRSMLGKQVSFAEPSNAVGPDSVTIQKLLKQIYETRPPSVASFASDTPSTEDDIPGQLEQTLALFIDLTSKIAMYLDTRWRKQLLEKLIQLLDAEDWESDFALPSAASFSTFLRMVIYLHPTKRPGLGISHLGHILASWRRGEDRIVIECLPNDEVRWVLSRTINGERESGAGNVQIHRIPEVTEPYDADLIFTDADKILA